MKTPMANIPLALTECLQPSEVGGLVEEAARAGTDIGQVLVLAVREFLASRKPPAPGSALPVSAPAAQPLTPEGLAA